MIRRTREQKDIDPSQILPDGPLALRAKHEGVDHLEQLATPQRNGRVRPGPSDEERQVLLLPLLGYRLEQTEESLVGRLGTEQLATSFDELRDTSSDDLRDQRIFARKVPEQRPLSHPGPLGDEGGRDTEAVLGEDGVGGRKQGIAVAGGVGTGAS
nr:hypothetical protein [Hyalangium versicolor]